MYVFQVMTSPFRNLILVTFCGLSALCGCNVFNPSGSGDPDGYDAYVSEGVKCLKEKEFSKAREAFEKAVTFSPHGREAWDGWIEARFGEVELQTGIGNAALLTEMRKMTGGNNTKPLWDLSLGRRDTFYRYLQDLDSAERKYLGGLGVDSFPDATERQAYRGIRSAYALVKVCDYDGDGRITAKDTLMINVCSEGGGGLTQGGAFLKDKLEQMMAKLQPDSVTGEVDTAALKAFNSFVTGTDTLLKSLKETNGGDKNFAQVDSFLSTRANEIQFYQVGDSKDNDGDGCVDEEIVDGYDNDGDGFSDEDLRIAKSVGTGTNARAVSAMPDAVDTSRLVDPSDAMTGQKRTIDLQQLAQQGAMSDSLSSALSYVTGNDWDRFPGLFKRYLPYVDPTNASYAQKHWKLKPESAWKTNGLANTLGVPKDSIPTTADRSDGVHLSHAQILRLRRIVLGIPVPYTRITAGRILVGGCWWDVPLPAKPSSRAARRRP